MIILSNTKATDVHYYIVTSVSTTGFTARFKVGSIDKTVPVGNGNGAFVLSAAEVAGLSATSGTAEVTIARSTGAVVQKLSVAYRVGEPKSANDTLIAITIVKDCNNEDYGRLDDVIDAFYHNNKMYLTRTGTGTQADPYVYSNEIKGESGKIYLDLEGGGMYRWNGTEYVRVSMQQVQSDWAQTSDVAVDYIKNKPVTNYELRKDDLNDLYLVDVSSGEPYAVVAALDKKLVSTSSESLHTKCITSLTLTTSATAVGVVFPTQRSGYSRDIKVLVSVPTLQEGETPQPIAWNLTGNYVYAGSSDPLAAMTAADSGKSYLFSFTDLPNGKVFAQREQIVAPAV